MRCKVGNLLVNNKKFPIWIENIAEDILLFIIQIICNQNDVYIIDNELMSMGYHKRWIGKNESIGVWKVRERDNILLELQTFVNDKLAEVDFDALQNLFTQVDKYFVVRRLE